MDIYLLDQMKIFQATGSISLNINLPLSRIFSFEDSEMTCTDCFYMELAVGHPITRRIENHEIPPYFAILWRSSMDFVLSSPSLQKLWSWCGLCMFFQELIFLAL